MLRHAPVGRSNRSPNPHRPHPRPSGPEQMAFDRITVLGAGAWGTALANVAARAGRRVTLWARDPDAAATMARTRASSRLAGVRLEDGVAITASMASLGAADA